MAAQIDAGPIFDGGWTEGCNLSDGGDSEIVQKTTISYFPFANIEKEVAKIIVNRTEGSLKVGVVGGFDDGSPAKIGDLLEIG